MALSSYASTSDVGNYLRDVQQTAAVTSLWTTMLDRASRFIDEETGQFFYQLGSTTYLLNGNGSDEIYPNFPIVSVSLLEIAYFTGAAFNTVTAGQYFLSPNNPQQGHPYFGLQLTNIPTQGQAVKFYRGIQNVRLTCVAGWPSIPSPIGHLTCKLVARMWKQRDVGFTGIAGNAADGTLYQIRNLDTEDKYILNQFCRPALGIQEN